MAGRGPAPKPAALRQRQNKTAPGATLPSAEMASSNVVPPLPARPGGWHPMVAEWWDSIWRSPMASEWLDADVKGGLYLLAELHQARWTATFPADLIKACAEIRLQEVRFGLSPIDRSRLRWEVAKGDEAAERTEGRRKAKAPRAGRDPRDVLKAVG